jgi:hypothetical protein
MFADHPGEYEDRASIYLKLGRSQEAVKDLASACRFGSEKACKQLTLNNTK